MKEKIGRILVSKSFTDWLKTPETVKRLVEGGRGRNQRELLIRNKIFEELDKMFPGIYQRETRRIDISNPSSNTTIEFGHNGLWQPSYFHINKPITDFYKRAKAHVFNNFYAVHFITDIVQLDPTHSFAESYKKPGIQSLGINRMEKNRNIAR